MMSGRISPVPRNLCSSLASKLRRALLAAVLLSTGASLGAEVIVERVGSASADGLAVGDRLVAWEAVGTERSGAFAVWSDAEWLDYEATPLAPLRVRVSRDGESRTVDLPSLQLEIAARPSIVDETRTAVREILADPTREESTKEIASLVAGLPGLPASWALTRLAEARKTAGDLAGAAETYQAAAGAHEGPFAGELLRRAAETLTRVGDLERAEALYRRAHAIWERHDRGGLSSSTALAGLGSLHARRHDFETARRILDEACGIRRRLAPGSWFLADCINNQGVMHGRAGDLGMAESRFLEALEIRRRLGDDGKSMLANLGVVARLRGDLERARIYAEQALAIDRERGETLEIADRLENLGNVVMALGSLREAVVLYTEALELLEEANPSGPDLAHVLYNRGKAYRLLEELDSAKADLTRARRLYGFEVPRQPLEASVAQLEGEVAYLEGDLERADEKLTQGLEIQSRFRPDSGYEAQVAASLAAVRAARGDAARADALFRQAIRAVERQQERIGGGDRGLVAFRTKYAGIYRSYLVFLLEAGRIEAALELYERSRAQGLRALLSGREIGWSGAGSEITAERDRLSREIETGYRELAETDSGAEATRRELRASIEALHAERDALSARMYGESERTRRLEVPAALDPESIRKGLPAGVLALAYSVGSGSTTLFVVERGRPVEVHRLEVSREELGRRVDRWGELAADRRPRAELRARSESLGALLLGPAASRIREASSLLIIPDGPLHSLPFAALPVAGEPRVEHLVEIAPVERAASVSVYLSELGRRTPGRFERVFVLGDPATPEEALARYRRELGRLPSAREEARVVRRQFGDRARMLLGEEATEGAVRRELPGADLGHFACHAVVDEALPMDSALVLAPTEGSTGLLHAWEIVEDLELEADLVVLSACQTARGGDRAGEGIVGLVRALQIAGARNVIATLWNVSDESTAVLMERFYRHLAAGDRPAAALRKAQLDLLRGPVESVREGRKVALRLDAPRHWAPFVLLGVAD